MRKTDDHARKKMVDQLLGSLALLGFGCLMLAYLVAIDRTEWFNLRPASGTAAAMSNASGHARPEHPAATGPASAEQ
jgi:hypothetical protein